MSSFLLDISLDHHSEDIKDKEFLLDYSTSSKFAADKINFQNQEYHLLLDGIVLNKKQLLNEGAQTNWPEFLIEAYKKTGNQFFEQLKGSYYGFLLDKQDNKWIIFTDHIGSKPLYFSQYNNNVCFSNSYVALIHYLKKKNQSVTLNEQGAYLLLSYGYVFEDITITNQIKRLMVGFSAVISNGKLRFDKFYTLKNDPIDISEEDAIEEIDNCFRRTVQLAFEKDKDYGYDHIATLSGGLDSRMTVWVAHELGYINQLNVTFSQSNYLDETIAKQIAADLKHEWLFKALDNGNILYDIDEITKITGGNVLYYGLAHGMSVWKCLNLEKLGILHSGQLGDVVVSTFYSTLDGTKKYQFGDGAYSSVLLPKINQLRFQEEYPNEEIFKMYIRGFYGANQGLLGAQQFSESYSPFYDHDFMEFALSIPLKLRFNHDLYKKWIIKKYPEAAKYIWEKEKVAVNYPYHLNILNKHVPLSQIHNKILAKLGYNKYGLTSKNHMNPLEYWYRNNRDLRIFMDKYYQKNICLLDDSPQLKTDCEKLYFNFKGTEKIQVLSLLGAVNYLCCPK